MENTKYIHKLSEYCLTTLIKDFFQKFIFPIFRENEEDERFTRIDKEISQQLRKHGRIANRTIKILLLGAGESGKSTFIKQMRIIHAGGYSENDRKGFISSINQNMCFAIYTLIEEMKRHPDLEYDNSDAKSYIDGFEDMEFSDLDYFSQLSDDAFDGIETLWNDKGIQYLYQKKNTHNLSDSTKYYFDNIKRIRNASYIPSVDDVLRVRVQTEGINEYPFKMNGITIKMIDVGGQRGERKKWINCFDDVSSIIFLAAMSGYDEISDEHENKLELAISIFDQVINYKVFDKTSVILFLNKVDLFEEKLKRSNIGDYFKEYKGPASDVKQGKNFIKGLFLRRFCLAHEGPVREANFFSHYTCATDTENIKIVFNATKEIFLRRILMETALN